MLYRCLIPNIESSRMGTSLRHGFSTAASSSRYSIREGLGSLENILLQTPAGIGNNKLITHGTANAKFLRNARAQPLRVLRDTGTSLCHDINETQKLQKSSRKSRVRDLLLVKGFPNELHWGVRSPQVQLWSVLCYVVLCCVDIHGDGADVVETMIATPIRTPNTQGTCSTLASQEDEYILPRIL